MKEKKLLLSTIILFLTISGCRKQNEEWERNPNLRLLISYANNRRSCFNPVWASTGDKIYYLLTPVGKHPWEAGGQLRVINVDGTGDKLVLDGEFGALAISSDGSQLALTADATSDKGGRLILIDINGSILDTISTCAPKVLDVEFGTDSSKLYYFAYDENSDSLDGFYEINLETDIETRLISLKRTPVFRGFDISNSDSLLFYENILYNIIDSASQAYSNCRTSVWPQFCPTNETFVAFGSGSNPEGYLMLLNLNTNNCIQLEAKPYEYSALLGPYWNPTGDQMIFPSATTWRGEDLPLYPRHFELWILEKVWE
jgi:Tol biopolymer transport system component